MPNWCISNIVFKGEEKEIRDFHKRLLEILEKPSVVDNGFGSGWLGDVLVDFGFKWDEGISCRGCIEHIEDEIEEGELNFQITTMTAWVPVMEMWDLILKENYPSVSYVYLAEEPGGCLYINTDIDKEFFLDEYHLEAFIPETIFGEYYIGEYFESEKEVVDYVNNLFNRRFLSIKEIEGFVEKIKENELYEKLIFEVDEFESGIY